MPENKEGLPLNEAVVEQPKIREEIPVMVDVQAEKKVFVPREVKTWMQKVEEDPLMNKGQKIKGDDDSVLQPIAKTPTKISLSTSKQVFTSGFGKPVDDAWRWLSEFILRVIKKNDGKVKFKEE